MKNLGFTIGLILVIAGFVIAVYSPFYVMLGLPVFLIGAILIGLSPKKRKTKVLIIILPLVLWFPCMWLWLYSYNTFFNRAYSQTILIPDNYEGRFMVIYGEPCAEKPTYEKERLVLKIPQNGILIVQPPFKAGFVDDEFYLVDKNGKRTKIGGLLGYEERLKKHPGVLLGSSGSFGNELNSLPITSTEYHVFNKDTVDRLNYKKMDSLANELVYGCRGLKSRLKQ